MPFVRMFALVVGVVYTLVGIIGFIPSDAILHPITVMAPDSPEADMKVRLLFGNLLGLFPVNIVHSIVHLLIGLWGMHASRLLSQSRLYALGLAVVYLLLAVMGLIPGLRIVFGLIPLYGHDIWLHALTGAAAAFAYFSSAPARTTTVPPPAV